MTTKLPSGVSLPSKFKWVTLKDFEELCFGLANAHMQFDEPIPSFITRNVGILESCIETPRQGFGGVDPYPTLIDKLSILFYLLIKNHPFRNGNKRTAVATIFVILYLNGLWLETGELFPYKLAKFVASSNRSDKDEVVKHISKFISKNLIKFKPRNLI